MKASFGYPIDRKLRRAASVSELVRQFASQQIEEAVAADAKRSGATDEDMNWMFEASVRRQFPEITNALRLIRKEQVNLLSSLRTANSKNLDPLS